MWDPSLKGTVVPLNIDKRCVRSPFLYSVYLFFFFNQITDAFEIYRFVMLRGSSGFYTYSIYEHLDGWPDFDIAETRVAFKLRKDR